MSESENTNLKTQYAARVTADLEQNTAEQQRIRADIEALQAQLTNLEQDHELLQSMSEALGDTAPPKKSAMPAPRRANKTSAAAPKKADRKTTTARAPKAGTPAKETKGAKDTKAAKDTEAAKAGSGAKSDTGPAMTTLVFEYLTQQSEPRTNAEITKALTDTQKNRKVNGNAVRTASETLVARSKAERTKQGSTVFYSAITHDRTEEPARELAEAAA